MDFISVRRRRVIVMAVIVFVAALIAMDLTPPGKRGYITMVGLLILVGPIHDWAKAAGRRTWPWIIALWMCLVGGVHGGLSVLLS